jgi:hypothetical protein
MSLGVPNVRPACFVDLENADLWTTVQAVRRPCRAWPPEVEPPQVFGHADCVNCAKFTRNPGR